MSLVPDTHKKGKGPGSVPPSAPKAPSYLISTGTFQYQETRTCYSSRGISHSFSHLLSVTGSRGWNIPHLLYQQAPRFWSSTACAACAAALGWMTTPTLGTTTYTHLRKAPKTTTQWERNGKLGTQGGKFLQDHRKRSHSTDVLQFKQSRDQERKGGKRQGKPWKGSPISRLYLLFKFQHFQNPFQQGFSFFSMLPTALAIANFCLGGGTFILKPWHSPSC